ncbi:MAG: hypothetical protein D6703_05350 [Zetaproteobacteria bacterium]|nr:MAG: hypothetical protein D6703_05350 [Zetaproteobacteria bacterium]
MAMTDRRKIIRRKAWLALLLTIAFCAASTLAASWSHVRWDWTEDGLYTLSDSTRSVLQQLDAPIRITAYITSGLPQPYGLMRRFIEDMLQAYHEEGGDKVAFSVIDPSDDPKAMTTLTALNVPKVRVQLVENDQARVKQGYLAIVLDYLDKREVLPVISSETGFEYLLTSKIRKLTGKGRPKIGIVDAYGSDGYDRLTRLRQLAGEDYDFIHVDPATKPIPSDADALIVAGLEQAPEEPFRYRLEQFRLSGRGLMVLAGNAKAALADQINVRPVQAKANEWLKTDFGVAVEPGLVLDKQSGRILVHQPRGMFMLQTVVDYPFLLRLTDAHDAHPVTRHLKSVQIPFASPLALVRQQGSQALLSSSEFSTVQQGPPFDVDPLKSMQERFDGAHLKRSLVAVVHEGPGRKVFKKAPKGLEKEVMDKRADVSRWVVIGAPSMLEDELLDENSLLFVLNVLDWLSGQDDMIDLRSRGGGQRPLSVLEDFERNLWKLVWMLVLPGVVVLMGLLRWRWLRRRRAA